MSRLRRTTLGRLGRISPQNDQILSRSAGCAAGRELQELEALGQDLAHVALRMEGGAEVQTGCGGPAHDEAPGLEPPPLVLGEPFRVLLSVRRQDEQPARSENSS